MEINISNRARVAEELFRKGSNRRMDSLTINETYAMINQLGEGYNFIYGTFGSENCWLQITGRDEYA